jgi:hypothetical protein
VTSPPEVSGVTTLYLTVGWVQHLPGVAGVDQSLVREFAL